MPTRLALRLAYDGTRFRGSQRQPGKRTVEGELLDALEAVGAGGDPGELAFQMAGRTDRGVSAACNVAAVTTGFRAAELPKALNAHLHDAWVTGWAVVPTTWNPRHARSRTYRYHLPARRVDRKELEDVLARFEGTHDFGGLARREAHRDPSRRVRRTDVRERDGLLLVDVVGDSFLWNQVRRMVAVALEVVEGRLPPKELTSTLDSGTPLAVPPLPPEPLVLLEVAYDDVTLTPVPARGLTQAVEDARVRHAVLATLRVGDG